MSVARQEETIEERPKVLVVDDEPFNLEIMQEILEEEYEVSYVKSGQECMDLVGTLMPDVILLDVNMPGMSGYEVCQQIKENTKTTNIPVTFVSALDTLAERLAGYEVGGDDYICKPFEASELLSKVTIAVKYKKEKESLRIDAERAMEKARSAMRGTDDSGVLVDFLRESLACDNIEKLADLTLYTIGTMGLRSSVQIRNGDDVVHKSSDGSVNQLERTVVKKMSKEDRMVDLGIRTVFNQNHVSVLVKNMTFDDDSTRQNVKNKLSFIAEALEMRILAFMQLSSGVSTGSVANVSEEFRTKSIELQNMVAKIEKTLSDLSPKYLNILANLSYNLETAFSSLALTEQQEQAILSVVDDAVSEAHAIQATSENVSEQASALITSLSGLFSSR
ncbi:response regulator [Kaarinaea lacus]